MPLDQFIHVLILRPMESSDTMIMCQLLLLKAFEKDGSSEPNPFHTRVEAMKSFPADHWQNQNYHLHHMSYHSDYPETFNFEILAKKVTPQQHPQENTLPVYFGYVKNTSSQGIFIDYDWIINFYAHFQ